MFKVKPTMLYRKEGLYFNPVHTKGRGLFCAQDIKKGELLEVAPVFLFNEEDSKHVEKTIICDYYFSAEGVPEAILRRAGIVDGAKASCMAMGAMSYCNHMAAPNASAEKIAEHHTLYYSLVATKDIPQDTEITINYGIAWISMRKIRDYALKKKAQEGNA